MPDKIVKEPLVSIVVPVYNVESCLQRCLDSIVHQTYRNLEIILVDDGSTDRSGVICDEYAATDPRIVVRHRTNGGVAAARNTGLDTASGVYLLFLDSDDRIEAGLCEQTISLALEHQADVVMFGYREIFPSGLVKTFGTDIAGVIEKGEMIRQLVLYGVRNYLHSKLFLRELLDGLRFPLVHCYEDVGLIHEVMHRSQLIYATPQVFYNYIRRDGSLSNARYTPQSIKDILYVWDLRLEFLLKHYPEHAEYLLSQILWQRITGVEMLKGDPDYPDFLKGTESFESRFRPRFKSLTKYSPLIWLYVYCRPLARLYVRCRYHNNKLKNGRH